MLQEQNFGDNHKDQMERSSTDNRNSGFLDLNDILYPQTISNQSSSANSKGQQKVQQDANQIEKNFKALPLRMENNQQIISLLGNRQDICDHQVNSNQLGKKAEQRSRQSIKHNFPKLLVRKIKDVMKKILNIKRKEKLVSLDNLKELYFYLFHQTLKKHENLEVFQFFLENQNQLEQQNLVKFLKIQVSKHGIERDINYQMLQTLKQQLRMKLIQYKSLLLSLVEKGSIKRKQQFKLYVMEFFDSIKQGLLQPSQK